VTEALRRSPVLSRLNAIEASIVTVGLLDATTAVEAAVGRTPPTGIEVVPAVVRAVLLADRIAKAHLDALTAPVPIAADGAVAVAVGIEMLAPHHREIIEVVVHRREIIEGVTMVLLRLMIDTTMIERAGTAGVQEARVVRDPEVLDLEVLLLLLEETEEQAEEQAGLSCLMDQVPGVHDVSGNQTRAFQVCLFWYEMSPPI